MRSRMERAPSPNRSYAPSNARSLHRLIGLSMVILSTSLIIMRYYGAVGETSDGSSPLVAYLEYALIGLPVIVMTVALLVFKPRVPKWRSGQSVTEYWSNPVVSARATLVWFLLDGAGTIAAAGYFVTGSMVSAATMALAIAAFWFTGPNAFAKE
jgi:hypothetical protein